MLRTFFLVCIIHFVGLNLLQAQENKLPAYQVGIKGGYGFIIPHSTAMEFITQQHISKLTFFAEKNTFGSRSWQQRYQFPRLGLSFNYFNLNNRKHLGNAYSLAPYMSFKILGKSPFQLRLKTTLGVGYLEKPFDPESNFKNGAIGSHINLFFSILLETEIHLSEHYGLTVGTNFSHFSNTSFKKPNKGINIPTIEGGLIYRFGEAKERDVKPISEFEKQKGFFRASLSFGLNEIYPYGGETYLASYFSMGYEKKLSFKSSIGGNLDVFYNPAQKAELEKDSIYIDAGWENTQLGISVNYTLHFGKFETYFLAGYYLKKEDEELPNIYTIFGGRVHLNDRLNLNIGLKTHIASAEYLMLGIGYKIGNN